MDPRKPVFFNKSERERLALERRQAAVSGSAPRPSTSSSASLFPLHRWHLPRLAPIPLLAEPPTEGHDFSRADRDQGRKRGRDHGRERDRLKKTAAKEREKEQDAIKQAVKLLEDQVSVI
ncbi:hypothetical protein E2562_000215 [Oryza meyeriana var. granulata]|uniref:Uncharacterized protein n=1 Tax=Oryza meyeriana var. granulata TaxID=110450 RepID=A0A6G1CMM4_9ORYZ|nr:hypothetical protein E2562_000215 [Oryza meyeriana var. granulata]